MVYFLEFPDPWWATSLMPCENFTRFVKNKQNGNYMSKIKSHLQNSDVKLVSLAVCTESIFYQKHSVELYLIQLKSTILKNYFFRGRGHKSGISFRN